MNIKKVKNTFEKKVRKKAEKSQKKNIPNLSAEDLMIWSGLIGRCLLPLAMGIKCKFQWKFRFFFTKISFILILTSICCSFDELISFYLWIYFPFRYLSPVALLALAKFRFYIWIHNDCLWFFSILIFELICIH